MTVPRVMLKDKEEGGYMVNIFIYTNDKVTSLKRNQAKRQRTYLICIFAQIINKIYNILGGYTIGVCSEIGSDLMTAETDSKLKKYRKLK
jgi:hypothetical protein